MRTRAVARDGIAVVPDHQQVEACNMYANDRLRSQAAEIADRRPAEAS
jgi:hypothetical protein